VVGVPLPLVSYGGSALIVLMAGFGIIISALSRQP
ncbi:FtsW/RodA/SpoVE family cell cycle protein, partial [Escherichia coli]